MIKNIFLLLLLMTITACGAKKVVRPAPAPPAMASKTIPATAPDTPNTNNNTANTTNKPGGYYLDDGPGDNPPKDIDSIANASPKKEPLIARANKPYVALGTTYTPMTAYQPYKLNGVASWYGKRYHGKNTSSGEVYDMYAMTAAHPTLPLPSYVKVTNASNGRWVIVRVNDRGPFKSNRIIDLSYAAAYKLRFSNQGSSNVIVETIDPSKPYIDATTILPVTEQTAVAKVAPPVIKTAPAVIKTTQPVADKSAENNNLPKAYFIQAGAFKGEANANALIKKIQGLDISQNAGINNVYNNGLYRLKLGPYDTKQEADQVASKIRKQLNTSVIITNQ